MRVMRSAFRSSVKLALSRSMRCPPILARTAFHAAVFLGRPFGGIRPRRIYHQLAHAGFPEPAPRWQTTGLGLRMKLSPFYHLDREIIAFGQYDGPLHRFFNRFVRLGMVCVDAGANIGDSTLHLAQLVGPSGRVYAFEPAPFPRQRLAEHVVANGFANRVSINACALADVVGTATFAFSEHNVENQGMGSLVTHDNHVVTRSAEVPLSTLDAFVIENDLPTIDLIKVDIQGAELMFLRGAESVIRQKRPIMCMELSPGDLAASGADAPGLVRLIESLGYVVHSLNDDGSTGRIFYSAEIRPNQRANNVICVPAA
jgi:FkbM family methyltransferase